MSNYITCATDGPFSHLLPTISFVENPMTNKMGFVLKNFDIEEPVDAYTVNELIAIRDGINNAINKFGKPSDIDGQMFLWDFDLINLTVPKNDV